ncbi:PstS family phosphate ABC transporter substrate-binding protein [Halostella salina]|uniref:PstS family phosphate ABC transporter substrate-binding protein n=1 Tax=Halostella salina TaxID=1547897 RepID=UPI000EF7FE20|nr:PstS family phosphate ABC transporter substrate-binding protein [Halostella salina]
MSDQTGTAFDISRRKFLAASGAASATALAGCNVLGSSSGLTGSITISGSSTVHPVSAAMAEEFQRDHSGVDISLNKTGTGGGFSKQFCPGDSEINGASRPITDSERESCASNGVEPLQFQIGSDALTVAVNPEADWVDCMTVDELNQIWQPDGAQQWSDVRDEWPDEEIKLYGAASTSGTFDWFTEYVNGEVGRHRSDYEATENDNRIVQGVEGDEYAMGYFGYSYYAENQDRVKAVSIDAGSGCTEPSLDNAKDDSYPMARPLFIYVAEGALQEEAVVRFLEFYFEQAAGDIVRNIGYVPSSDEMRETNLSKLDEHAGGGASSTSEGDGNESS